MLCAMPTLALNTAGMTADASERAVREAHAAGVTHVDFHPGIERDGVAKALGAVSRADLFLTTKIRKPAVGTAPAAAGELVSKQVTEDLKVLGLDTSSQQAALILQRYDADRSGLLGLDEFARLVQQLREHLATSRSPATVMHVPASVYARG